MELQSARVTTSKPNRRPALILLGCIVVLVALGTGFMLRFTPIGERFFPAFNSQSHLHATIFANADVDDIHGFREDLVAIDGDTGKIKWRYQGVDGVSIPVVSAGDVFITNNQNVLVALDQKTGAVRWSHKAVYVGAVNSVVIIQEFGALNAHDYLAVDAQTGQTRWRIDDTSAREDKQITVIADHVYLANHINDSELILSALNPANGVALWQAQLTADRFTHITAAFADMLIYDARISLIALSNTNGQTLWQKQTSGAQNAPYVGAVALCGAQALCLEYSDGSISAIARSTGTESWHYTYPDQITGGLFFVPLTFGDDAQRIVAQGSTHLTVLNKTDGALLWQQRFTDSATIRFSTPYPLDHNLLILNARSANAPHATIQALDAASGKILWQSEQFVGDGEPPFLFNDHVYQVAGPTLACFDAYSGKILWSSEIAPQAPHGIGKINFIVGA